MWHRLLTLIVKELQALLRTTQGRRMLIMPVVIQLAVFPFAATLEVKNATLAIYDQDQGAASIELTQRLGAGSAFTRLLVVHDEAGLKRAIDEKRALLALRFAPDFSRRVESGQPADIQAIIDGRRSNSAQIAFSYVGHVVDDYALERGNGNGSASQIAVRNLYNPDLEYRWFVLPCLIAIITTVGCLIVTALSLAREREEGTFEQLLVSPLTPAYIMAGKAAPAILVAMVQATLIAAAAVWIFHVPMRGPIWLLYLGMLCYSVSLIGFGLFISALCSTQQQAFLGVFCFMAPAVILSGYMAPVENMPPVLQWVSAADPLTHFIIIVKGVFLKNYDFALAWPELWPLLLIAAITLALAYGMFRRHSA
ncbi:ABC transporter permease [Paludibacterium yongneupense]|uniref:ABC transporter permease n=1 Tax=Paludibacterium yongneupense TaxID=400061 RepID=UPI00040700A9|nr:ABC transporter permease [Paludibacterium yongneupense]